jgi:tetratricopeptide (TPR) repeat protein
MDLLQNYIRQLNLYRTEFNQNEFNTIVKEAEKLIEHKNTNYEEKLELYEVIINVLEDNFKWKESIKYLISWSDLVAMHNDYNNYISILTKVIRAEMKLSNYETAYLFIKFLLNEIKKYNNKEIRSKKILFFNMSITCAKLQLYEEAIIWAHKLELELYLTPIELAEVRLVLAGCYKDLKEYKNAESLYWEIIASSKFSTDAMTIARAYRNLSELKHETGNNKEAEEYLDIAMTIDTENKEDNMLSKYYTILIMLKLDKAEFIHRNFYDTLNSIYILSDRKKEIDLILMVIHYYINNNYLEYLEIDMSLIEKSIFEGKCTIEGIHELFFDVGLYFESYDTEKSFRYFHKKMEIRKYFELNKNNTLLQV